MHNKGPMLTIKLSKQEEVLKAENKQKYRKK
jgi:hypothetical protein